MGKMFVVGANNRYRKKETGHLKVRKSTLESLLKYAERLGKSTFKS
jgi:hypothetical protein